MTATSSSLTSNPRDDRYACKTNPGSPGFLRVRQCLLQKHTYLAASCVIIGHREEAAAATAAAGSLPVSWSRGRHLSPGRRPMATRSRVSAGLHAMGFVLLCV